MGEWDEGSGYGDRRAVGINVWATEDQYQMAILDPNASPWSGSRVIGPMMARGEALGHPELRTYFHIAEHVIAQDPVVSSFFGEEQ